MKKLIINLATTGMIPTKAMSEHVPVSPAEIIADTLTARGKSPRWMRHEACTRIGAATELT